MKVKDEFFKNEHQITFPFMEIESKGDGKWITKGNRLAQNGIRCMNWIFFVRIHYKSNFNNNAISHCFEFLDCIDRYLRRNEIHMDDPNIVWTSLWWWLANILPIFWEHATFSSKYRIGLDQYSKRLDY